MYVQCADMILGQKKKKNIEVDDYPIAGPICIIISIFSLQIIFELSTIDSSARSSDRLSSPCKR